MSELKSKPCYVKLIVVAVLSFMAGIITSSALTFVLTKEAIVSGCFVLMAIMLGILVSILIKETWN